jgi:uncharacterized protein YeaO (DUF488 family)
MGKIRIDCYLHVLDKFKRKYPDAHFEIITRANHDHILSPSWDLLNEYKKYKKIPQFVWDGFTFKFTKELENRKGVMEKLREFKELSKEKDVFLVCYEKNPYRCHRSVVKHLIDVWLSPYSLNKCIKWLL